MRLGMNLLCATAHLTEEHRPLLERAKAIGYDLVEVPMFSGDPDHYAGLGRMLDEIGLARTTVSITPSADANPVAADPDAAARGREHLDWIVACGAALGALSLGGPFHAPLGVFTGLPCTADERARGAAAHRAMADTLPEGCILSIEALNRFETYFLNTADEAVAYAERIGHPRAKLMLDTFHMNIEERDPIAATERAAGHIGVYHVSENDRGIPGRGHIDFAAHFAALKRGGWDGILVIEAFGNALPELAAATRVWRPLFPDLDTLMGEGHDHIRRAWEIA